MRWTPAAMDRLERAARLGKRVSLLRRGTEFVVIALALRLRSRGEELVVRLPMTGEELTFALEEIDDFTVVD